MLCLCCAGVASPPDVSMDSGLLQRVLGIETTSFGNALEKMQAATDQVRLQLSQPRVYQSVRFPALCMLAAPSLGRTFVSIISSKSLRS